MRWKQPHGERQKLCTHWKQFDGKIFAGYGDYGEDTGPIQLRYFDTTTGLFGDVLSALNTEAIFRIRNIGSQTYALTTDPLEQMTGGYHFSVGSSNGLLWSAMDGLAGLHFYDLASYESNSHLFLAGSGGPTDTLNAMVYEKPGWRRKIGRSRWTLRQHPVFFVFYGIGKIGDRPFSRSQCNRAVSEPSLYLSFAGGRVARVTSFR